MYKSDIQSSLSSFLPMGLEEMDEVNLMNRVETKYVFSSKKLPDLLKKLSESYKALDIDLSTNFRTFNKASKIDEAFIEGGLDYNFSKHLSLAGS
jgi:hypothetical protein